MVVKLQNNGAAITGIRFKTSDVRRYFPRGQRAMDLNLDELLIRCELPEGFWENSPEISDPRLCAWLEQKFFLHKLTSTPASVEMSKELNGFRLRFLCAAQQAVTASFGLSV